MSLDLFRTIKIKSVENAIYNRSYNRCRFLISPDDMATDLSQSYLAFKLFIINGKTGLAYTPNEIRDLEQASVMFSFGQNDEAYSPACLIKTARLYALGNQSEILEEINYSNVLSQTLFQLKNDFETLASESLLTMSSTGMFLNGSLSASTTSYFGSSVSSTNDGSVQVNVKLSDLFGICKSTNFWLSQTNGLEVYLEFEDVKPLIRQSCQIDFSTPLPNTMTSTSPSANTKVLGYKDDYSSNHYPYAVTDQNRYALSNSLLSATLSGNTVISTPQCLRFDKSYLSTMVAPVDTAALVVGSYYKIVNLATGTLSAGNWQTAGCLPLTGTPVTPTVGYVFKCVAVTVTGGSCITVNSSGEPILVGGTKSNTINIVPTLTWDATCLENLGLADTTKLKLVFKIQQPGHVDRIFEHITEIFGTPTAWTSATVGAVITLSDYFVIPIFTGTYLTGSTVILDSFEILPNSDRYMFEIASWNTLVQTGVLPALGENDIKKLQLAGVLSGGYLPDSPTLSGGNTMFNYAVNMRLLDDEDNPVAVYPDIVLNGEIPSLRAIYSNQSKKLPVQTGTLRVIKAVPNTTTPNTFDLHFDTMGLVNNNSLQAICLFPPITGTTVLPGLGNKEPANFFDLIAFNTKLPNQNLPTDQMVVGEWYGVTRVDGSVDWRVSGCPVASPASGVSFQCTAPFASAGAVVWCHPNKYNGGNVDKSWQITKSELVLVQHMKDPQMPPSMIYSTFKVEAATIENNSLTEYNRQFIIGANDRNCFNVLLCTPHYTGENQSLISKSRNINQYRFSVNNIDNTNRNIGVRNNTSFYPSSLHLDKLFDTMRNDVGSLKSLSGINGVSRSFDPPVVFPLKIYTASDVENQYLSPISSLTVQFAAYGDSTHNQFIESGAIFFFKQMFRMLPLVK